MKAVLRGYIRIVDIINKAMGYVLMAMLAVMTAIIFWQVFSRFVVGSSLAWSEELSRFLMIFMIFIGASLALRGNELISVELLLEKLAGTPRKVLVIIIQLVSIVFFIILIKYGYAMAESFSNQKAPSLGVSMQIIYLSLPLGGILMLINSIACMIEEFVGKGEK
ncbi:TRAP transporter small permease [Metasolibacillus sp.]|uniref:TRAP transporter small permease n=1 Tax=Metasolibacillus sp. TaxID=2703680 RepID=UPI0025CDD3AE|nr:TRAP transporter small permease [Metasolibacillus sp.]MCT6924477.1 TRAP transporter small permease [Metasolibacillus sp.]MCT6940680.1 TRAP transporter small permease [Metasolibacillus sp.]